MTTTQLTAAEWDKAMAFVLAAEDDSEGSTKGQKPPTRRRPAYVAPARAAIAGGTGWSEMQLPTPQVQTFTEIPPSGPADSGVTKSADAPSGTPPDKWATRIGTPQSTGTPAGSMASTAGTAAGWSVTVGVPSTGSTTWNAFPTGTADGSGPDASKTTTDTLNKSVRTSLASTEDLHTTPGGEAALPDGSFMICTANDVQNCVDKVKNADEQNPRAGTHPWYADVKAHIARRAGVLGVSSLVPDGW